MRRRFLLSLVMAVALTVQAVLGAYAAAAIPAWTTYRHDAARSGMDPDSTSPVTPCGDIPPSIGVTSTPVIDPATDRIYVVGAVSASGAVHHELFAVDLSSGQPVAGFPIMADPLYPSGGAAVNQLQRAGLD